MLKTNYINNFQGTTKFWEKKNCGGTAPNATRSYGPVF